MDHDEHEALMGTIDNVVQAQLFEEKLFELEAATADKRRSCTESTELTLRLALPDGSEREFSTFNHGNSPPDTQHLIERGVNHGAFTRVGSRAGGMGQTMVLARGTPALLNAGSSMWSRSVRVLGDQPRSANGRLRAK